MTLGIPRSLRTLAACAVVVTVSLAGAVTAAAADLSLASPQPAFQEALEAGIARLPVVPAPGGLGHRAAPLAAPEVEPPTRALAATSFPSSYDLRLQGRVSPVRNQGSFGTCWAFATLASVESVLLPGEALDLSEDNVALRSGFDYDPYDGGGFSWMTAAYLARWGGPVLEADDPYGDYVTPAGLSPVKHLQQWIRLPKPASPTDLDVVKNAVTQYGAVDAALYWHDSYYRAANDAYHYSGTAAYANHEIDIVGWNDTYRATDFSSQPPGNGAFLCRNSWGADWGDGGYFWVSYYDRFITTDMDVFTGTDPVDNYSRVYQYDPLGEVDDIGWGTNTGWMANRFTAVAGETLTAVGFWVPSGNAEFAVYTGRSLATLTLDSNGSQAYAGFHTVALSSPVEVTEGQPFVVAVRLRTPGRNYPVPVEYPLTNYSSQADASAGQSYVSPNGSSWTDLTTEVTDANVGLKAYTSSGAGVDVSPPRTTSDVVNGSWYRKAVTLTLSATDSGSGVATTEYRVDDEPAWHVGTRVTIPAPADHSNDGAHTVAFRSTDNVGNEEQQRTRTVHIDTLGPRGATWAPASAVALGQRATIRFRVDDTLSPGARVQIVVRRANGRVVKRMLLGTRDVGEKLSFRLRCKFGRGSFKVSVGPRTADLAGNRLVASTRNGRFLRVR